MLYTYKAKCVTVVDGDVYDFLIDLGFNLTYKARVRLADASTPEIRAATEAERQHARSAKSFVERLMLDKTVTVTTHKSNVAFGRFLATVILPDNESLADKLGEADLLKRAEY